MIIENPKQVMPSVTTTSPAVSTSIAPWRQSRQSEMIDAADVAEANRRLADPNETRIPWEELKAELGI